MKQPSKVMIPFADKIQNIKLVRGGAAPFAKDTVSFSKNKDGLLQEEDVNIPRRYYRGSYVSYMSETDSTNYYKYSSEFGESTHLKTGTVIVTEDEEIAPNGKLESDKLMPLTEGSSSRFIQQNIASLPIGEFTFSVYAKFKGERYVRLVYARNSSPYTVYGEAVFDLVDGTILSNVSGQARIEDSGNGWYRISVTGTSTVSSNLFRISLGDTSTEAGSVEDGVLLWGGQVEESHSATSHIVTGSSSALRGNDEFTIGMSEEDITHFAVYYNLNLDDVGDESSRFTLTDGTSSNNVQVRSQPNGTSIRIIVQMDGELFSDYVDVGNYNNDIKIAFSFSDNIMNVSLDGEIVSSNTFTNISFGGFTKIINAGNSVTDDSTRFSGLINEVMYFPMTLSDAEINYITKN